MSAALTCRQLHERAMGLADDADEARLSGNLARHHEIMAVAYRFELAAAELVPFGVEPSRSVLYRSAATMARECGWPREVRELVDAALAGHPPLVIVGKLEALLTGPAP